MKFFSWLACISFCVLLYIFIWESFEYCFNPPPNIAAQGFLYVLQGSWFIASVNMFAYLLLDPFEYCECVDNKLFSILVIIAVLSLILSFMVWAIHGAIKESKKRQNAEH